MCVCRCRCTWSRQITLVPFLRCHSPYFYDSRYTKLGWNLPLRLGWLCRVFQRSYCFCLPSAEIARAYLLSGLFLYGFWGLNSGPRAFNVRNLPSETAPQPKRSDFNASTNTRDNNRRHFHLDLIPRETKITQVYL